MGNKVFEKGKKYVFRKDRFESDMTLDDGETTPQWVIASDGQEVTHRRVLDTPYGEFHVGELDSGCMVVPNWCEEVERC